MCCGRGWITGNNWQSSLGGKYPLGNLLSAQMCSSCQTLGLYRLLTLHGDHQVTFGYSLHTGSSVLASELCDWLDSSKLKVYINRVSKIWFWCTLLQVPWMSQCFNETTPFACENCCKELPCRHWKTCSKCKFCSSCFWITVVVLNVCEHLLHAVLFYVCSTSLKGIVKWWIEYYKLLRVISKR